MILESVVAAAVALGSPQEVAQSPAVITLEQALEIALSENVSVKVADREIERTRYAKKGTYAALFPQIDASGSYQRTLKKQKMYVDIPGMEDGMEVGRWNNWSGGVSVAMPLVNAQLWESLRISGQDVELAVEKARSSRLDMVTQVKEAFYAVLLAKELENVYTQVYLNAKANLEKTQKKYNVQKASEMDLVRSKANLASSLPNLYDSENAVDLALWQLKAIMGVNLEEDIDVAGTLEDYASQLKMDSSVSESSPLDRNTTLRQLAMQSEQLAAAVKAQQYAYIPSLSLGFNFQMSATQNEFNFNEYKWTPYSMVGLSLNIPIFSGGKRLASVKQSKIQLEEFQLQQQDAERQLRIALRQAIRTMDTNINTYNAALDALITSQKAFDIAQKSYDVGRSTLTDLNDAQLVLVQTQLSVSQSIYSFLVAKAGLEKILGQDFINQ
ncbi:MAG: TolC family protein [Bacteroidales bacterium]|nr:TolC family protein [Candidatus Cryptobacteroides fimicaballi]